MSSRGSFLDEQGMVDLARKAIEDLRKDVVPTELKRLENVLREGNVGEAFFPGKDHYRGRGPDPGRHRRVTSADSASTVAQVCLR